MRQLTTTVSSRSVVDAFDRKLRRISSQNSLGHTTAWEYDEFGNTTAMVDPRGTRTTYTYDARSNRLSATVVPLSLTSTWEYNHVLTLPGASTPTVPCNEATRITNPLNWPTNYSYDSRGNLLTQTDGIGTLVTHAYDTKGLVTSSTDANGNQTTFGYNATGFLTSRTIAAGTPKASTSTLVPSELGWLMSETNALSQTITYTRNINGQAVKTIDPLSRQFVKAFDANGNTTSESDAKGVATTYAYNDADERTSMTNRAGSTWTYSFNAWGEPYQTTTPAAVSDGTSRQETTTREYDNAGRLNFEADTYGDHTSFEYDANGNQTAVVDKMGRRWEKTYDLLNRPITSKDPLGNITTTSYDAAGRVKTITSPNGHPTQHEYDGRGRLIKWTDPMGSDWLYTYDGNANILDIEDALHGHYLMTYGPANERLTERNQDNQTWTYVYDALFRLQTQTDPNGTTRTYVRDAAGRTERVDFGSGRTNSLTYDDNNNPLTVIRSAPGVSATLNSLNYDSLDRLVSSTDTFGKTVSYTYDVLSRVVTKTYPGSKVLTHTYDRLHRLKGQSFNFGSQTFTSSFSYDQVGRLQVQNYPNGLRQVNSFDTAGRVTILEHMQDSTALIALTYAYDKNGNKTGGTNQGDVVWNPANVTAYDDTSRFTPAGKLIDRVDSAPASPKTLAYTYDASGNMTRAATPDNSEVYQLAYDEDNRTTSLSYTTSLTTKTIVNRYDAMGRRVSRTADGVQTRYVLDLLGDMERILCDTNASGTVTAWCVHSPAGLSYKVDTTGTLTCYHADAQGNIIRTSTTDGPDADTVPDTVSEYAYTPYGRRLVVTGPTSDPYRFVGSQGVMEELPNLYFMRARYYSAEAAVFLSTDPVKGLGVGWVSCSYCYASSQPQKYADPTGRFFQAGVDLNGTIGDVDVHYGEMIGSDGQGHYVDKSGGGGFSKFGLKYSVDVVQFGPGDVDRGTTGNASFSACGYYVIGGCINYGTDGLTFSGGFGMGGSIGVDTSISNVRNTDDSPSDSISPRNQYSNSPFIGGEVTISTRQDITPVDAGRYAITVIAKTVPKDNYYPRTEGAYTIQPGDTIDGLAQRFYTTREDILRENPRITNPNNIRSGSGLNMPANSSFRGGTSTNGGGSGGGGSSSSGPTSGRFAGQKYL